MLPFAGAFSPGLPIKETGQGDHPPRTFAAQTPGSLPRPAWAVLATLLGHPLALHPLREAIEAADPRFAGLADLEADGEGRRVAGSGAPPVPAPAPLPHCEPGETLRLLPVETLYGSELLSSLSPPLAAVVPAPHALLHADDAARLGLADGDRARLTTPLGHFSVAVHLSDRMAPGLVLMPRLRGTPLAAFVPGAGHLDCRLEKEAGT
jgi:NADH-quinone oxidoreductase subunit G